MTDAARSAEKHNGGGALGASVERSLENLTSELADFESEMRRFVRDRPLFALGAAIAAGYVVGRVLSKL